MTNPQVEDSNQVLEIIKGVAQAWYGHSGTLQPISEIKANRRKFKAKPSRFQIEALNKASSSTTSSTISSNGNWDFNKSLLDSYEIVNVSKRLERDLILDDYPFVPGRLSDVEVLGSVGKKRESKNSLRSFFNVLRPRRFNDDNGSPNED